MIFEVELDGLRIILLILINSNTMLSLHDFVDCYFRWIGYNNGNSNSRTSR